jgi:hypothetical protein
MTSNEIAAVAQQYRQRIEAILAPDELACFDTYEQRVRAAAARRDAAPMDLTSGEQAVLDKIAADLQAAALQKQLNILLRIETPPQ